MRVSTIRIPCRDLSLSEDFYSSKLGLKKIFGSVQKGFIGYQLDNAQIIIEPEEKGEFECGRFLGFSLETTNISSFYSSKIEAGVTFIGEPKKQNWGGIMTHILDCNGNSFSVIENHEK